MAHYCTARIIRSRRPALTALFAAALVAATTGCNRSGGVESVTVVLEDSDGGKDTTSREDVAQLAKREGEMWWYTSLPQEAAERFLALFRAQHPYLTTHLVRGSTFDMVQRVQTEIEKGEVHADVLHVLDMAIFSEMRLKGQLLLYASEQERSVPAKYKDPGYWSALRVVGLCMAYDSVRLDQAAIPQTWDELLDERWRGRIALKDAQTAGSAYAQYYFLRDEYGSHYWESMARQSPRIYKTADESLAALETGEVDVVSGAMGYSVSERIKGGSTVRAVWPSDGVPVMLGPVAILRGAPHRNAGKLFMDFALSKEGQEALRDLAGIYSVREDVAPPADRPSLSELKIMSSLGGWAEYARNQEALKSEYTGLFHPGSE